MGVHLCPEEPERPVYPKRPDSTARRAIELGRTRGFAWPRYPDARGRLPRIAMSRSPFPLVIAAVLLLGACSSPPPTDADPPPRSRPDPLQVDPEPIEVAGPPQDLPRDTPRGSTPTGRA